MKSFFGILCTGLFFLIAQHSNAQIDWYEIPPAIANPSAGQTSPKSYDVMIGDDGRKYAAYIFDNGTNQEIIFKEYVSGNWTTIYNDFVYSGFEAIHSFLSGGVIYVMVKRDNAVAQEQIRVYSILSGSVGILNTFDFSNMPDGSDYRAVLSEDADYIYMLHKDASQLSLKITQLNVVNGAVTSSTVPTGAATAYNYDLVEHQDTVYIGLTRDEIPGSFRTYLHKTDLNMGGVIPHHPGNTDGQMGGVAANNALMGIAMGKDQNAHQISILSSETAGNNFSYLFTPATLITTFGAWTDPLTPTYTAPAAVVNLSQSTLFFGGLTQNASASNVSMGIVKYNYASNAITPFSTAYPSSGAITDYRLSFSQTANKGIASFYNPAITTTTFWASNNQPTLTSNGTAFTVCPGATSALFSGMVFTDNDGEPVSISNIVATDAAMFPAGSLTVSPATQAGNTTTYTIFGTPAMGGTTTLTISFTDGNVTQTATVNVTVITTAPFPTFNQAALSICSNNGLVDLSSYVSQPGGTFAIGGITTPFSGMFYNSNLTGLPYETALQLDYTITSIGCNLTASAQLTLHESATVTVATSPTSCGGTNGSAIATIAGGTSPFLLQAWSSGQNNTTAVNNLAQGTYTFTVQDANLCSVIKEFTIVPTGVDIVPTITNATCFGANNAALSVTLNGFSAPTSLIWSSGHSSTAVSNLTPGTYTITVTDAANCIYTEAFTLTQPTELSATTVVNNPTCGNSDGTMEVQNISGGVSPYGVSWSSGGTNPLETNIPYGVYSATITDNSGCQTIKTVFVSEQNSANLTGSITGSQCGSSTGEIDVTPIMASGQTVQGIAWSTGQTTEDLSMIPPALYICTLTTNANCHAVKGWNIPIVAPELQPICVVTVDSLTSTNLVIWEGVQPVGIHHYNIYRETSVQGEYILIDTVEASNTSIFNDVVASPLSRSWSYKISAVNGCNVEGPLSPQHRTMHLGAFDAGASQTQVSWNAYEGTAYSNFVLWKFTDANLWEQIAILPTTQVSYIDNTDFAEPGLDYIVDLTLNEPCSAVKMAQDFNTTRSNKDKGNFSVGNGTGDSNNELNESFLSQISIFPNPTTGILNIEQVTSKAVSIKITDLSGKTILSSKLNSLHSTIDMNDLKPGIYLIEMTLNNTKRVERIVKI